MYKLDFYQTQHTLLAFGIDERFKSIWDLHLTLLLVELHDGRMNLGGGLDQLFRGVYLSHLETRSLEGVDRDLSNGYHANSTVVSITIIMKNQWFIEVFISICL
jgi:hypothetical protein